MAAAAQQEQSALTASTALELRLRALEFQVYGSEYGGPSHTTSQQSALLRARDAHQAIVDVSSSSPGPSGITPPVSTSSQHALRRFITQDFDASRTILSPSFAVRGSSDSSKDVTLTPAEQTLVALDAEPQLRAFERIMAECDRLQQRGAAGAGSLEGHEALKARLHAVRAEWQDSVTPEVHLAEDKLINELTQYQAWVSKCCLLVLSVLQTFVLTRSLPYRAGGRAFPSLHPMG